jgi:phage gp29-like protein
MSSQEWTQVVNKRHKGKKAKSTSSTSASSTNENSLERLKREYKDIVEEVVIELVYLQNEEDYARTCEQLNTLFSQVQQNRVPPPVNQEPVLEPEDGDNEVDVMDADPKFAKFRKLCRQDKIDSDTLQLLLDSMPDASDNEIMDSIKQIAGEAMGSMESAQAAEPKHYLGSHVLLSCRCSNSTMSSLVALFRRSNSAN